MNKKILAILMALLMVLMGSVAMAEDTYYVDSTTENDANFTITKEYTGTGKAEDTFNFAIAEVSMPETATSQPAIADQVITIAANAETGTATVNVPNTYTVPGVYTYTITETAGNTAGVAYNTEAKSYTLKVTAYTNAEGGINRVVSIRDEDGVKDANGNAAFKNEYTAGELSVTKKFAGNLSDARDVFELTVVFTAPKNAENVPLDIKAEISGTATDNSSTSAAISIGDAKIDEEKGTITYVISNVGRNDVVKFTNVPTGVTYAVTETLNTNGKAVGSESNVAYDSKIEGGTGTITTTASAATVTNTATTSIDTGVNTDSLPYFMLLAFVMILAAAVVLKKRTVNE